MAASADVSPVHRFLASLHARVSREESGGQVASYIPELARADPGAFGIAITTAEGETHGVGDTDIPFTIQSISKALLYGMALEDNGPEGVLARVGVEPTGEAFNSIRLQDGSGNPFNPMVNAGAIATTGLLGGTDASDRLDRILDTFGRYAGRPLRVDEAVYRSERDTGHRNRAIAHLLRNFSVIGDPEGVLDLYFHQCAIEATCHDLAMIGATLANKGVNPTTGVRALDERYVASVLSVMATCGMYDFAGQWLFDVGLPAKSGVAGGILAVLPGQLGIGTYSPPLDAYGNSARGIRVCHELSSDFALHLFDPPRQAGGALRTSSSCITLRSRRHRGPEALAALGAHGHLIRADTLQGDLMFTTAATAATGVLDRAPGDGFAIVDVTRVRGINRPAAELLSGLREPLAARGTLLLMPGAAPHPALVAALESLPPADVPAVWDDLDLALEWCEDELLHRLGVAALDEGPVALGDTELCAGMSAGEVADLAGILEPVRFAPGESLYRQGDASDHLVLITAGRAGAVTVRPDGNRLHLLTLTAGTFIGEGGLIDGLPRSVSVVAQTEVEAHRLPRAALERLRDAGAVRTRTTLLLTIARTLSERLRLMGAQLTSQ